MNVGSFGSVTSKIPDIATEKYRKYSGKLGKIGKHEKILVLVFLVTIS